MPHKIKGHNWQEIKYELKPKVLEAYIHEGSSNFESRFSRNQWTLDYTYRRSGYFRVEPSNTWKIREARTCHLYPPGTAYHEKNDRATMIKSAWFIFSGGENLGLEKFIDPKTGFAEFQDRDRLIGNIFKYTASLDSSKIETIFWNTQIALLKLLEILEQSELKSSYIYRLPGRAPSTKPSKLVQATIDYLESHINERASIKDIAHRLHVSESTLSHRFKQETRESPITALTRLRINNSKALLIKKYPLKIIAENLGFYDEYSFSKTFKRFEGISPKYFVKEYIK